MINKYDKNKTKNIFSTLTSIFAWLIIWEITARIIDIEFIFPGVIKTLTKLSALLFTKSFWISVLLSLFRIFTGLILGIIFSAVLSVLTVYLPAIANFISVGMTVVRSTPVAAIIMILWVLIGSSDLPIVIALLMVTPVIWQNLVTAFRDIDPQLNEITELYQFSRFKKFKILIFPSLLKYFIPAVLTSVGLAWKSGIASEIIAYTKYSIGENIHDAKTFFEGDALLSWTLVVIVFSIIFEHLIKFAVRRFSDNES